VPEFIDPVRENKPKTLVFSHRKQAFSACFREYWVYKFGHGSRIPDPKTATKERICCHTFLCSHKFHKIENYFSFEVLKKKIWASIQRIVELFTQKIVPKFSKIWVWDLRSGIQKKPIPDLGSKGQKGTRSRIRNTVRDVSAICSIPLVIEFRRVTVQPAAAPVTAALPAAVPWLLLQWLLLP
jgi:hypothetical protein